MSGSQTRRRGRLAGFRCTDQEAADIEAAAAMAGSPSKAAFIRDATMAAVVEVGMRAAGDGIPNGLAERNEAAR